MPVTQEQPPVLIQSPAPVQAQRALTRKSLALGLPFLLLWIFTISWAVPSSHLIQQQLILVGGFGAIFSLFFLKLLVDFLPQRMRPTAAELTFVYALLLAGIPASVMGTMALESAVTNHFLESVLSGRRGFIPDVWAPNPHLGLLPTLDPPDARCPYVELPPNEDGSPRRAALAPPPFEESRQKVQSAVAAAEQWLKQSQEAAAQYRNNREVVDTLREIENAAAVARGAAQEVSAGAIDVRRAAYLAWAAELAASLSARGPQCIKHADAVNGYRKGKVPVPWEQWLLPLLFWFSVMAAFFMLVLFGLLALRESWIDRERLPFPYARVAEGVIHPDPTARDDLARQGSFPRPLLGLAFILGLLFCVRGMVTISDTSWAAVPPGNPLLNLDLSGLNLIRGVSIQLVLLPFALLFILFFPLDLLFTVVVAYLVAQFGVPAFLEIIGVADRVDVRYQVLRMGGMLGISVFTVIFHRAELKRLVTGLWTRAKGERPDEALSPRELSAGFVLALTLFSLLLIIGEGATGRTLFTQVWMLLYTFAMIFIYNFSHVRARASGSFIYADFNNILHVGCWFNWHWFGMTHSVPMAQGAKIAQPDALVNFHSQYQMELYGAYSHSFGPATQLLDAFALADATRARLRDIFKGLALGLLLALLIGMPLYLIAAYHVGYDNTPMTGAWGSFTLMSDKAYRYYTKLNPGMFTTNSIWWCVSGAVLIGVCMYLRREYSRFPIEPMGLFIAGCDGGTSALGTNAIWFTFVVALAVKWVVFRWYGVRAFQEKVVPPVIYALMGMLLGIVLYLFLSALILSRGVAL